LDAAIRAKLDQLEYDQEYGNEPTIGLLLDAVRAALDLHAAPERALPGEIHCGELIDWVSGGCPTVRVIAEKLGIEVADD
jgi:hypothetical protein